MAINKISEFPKVTPSADDKILIEKNGEGGHINLSEMPVSKPVNDRITKEVKDLSGRISDLAKAPEGSTTGDLELRDIRRPATGFTVPANANAGDAVRAQVTQLDEKISNLKGDLSKQIEPLEYTETVGYYFASDGNLVQDTTATKCAYTSKIKVYEGETIDWILGKWKYGHYIWGGYMLYDSNENVVGTRIDFVNTPSESYGESGTLTIPTGVSYIAFSYRTYGDSNIFNGIKYFSKSTIDSIKKNSDSNMWFNYDLSNGSKGWILHGTGKFNVSDKTKCYVLNRNSLTKLKAFLKSDTNTIDGISFYSGTEIKEENYLSTSISWKGIYPNGTWYEVDIPTDADLICITSNIVDFTPKILFLTDEILSVTDNKYLEQIEKNTNDISTLNANVKALNDSVLNGLGNIYHFGMSAVSNRDTEVIIPSQSIYDIRYAKKIGYKCIEANLQKTSDGKYVVTHGLNGTLGHDFDDLYGNDAYGVVIADTSYDTLRSNYRYRSTLDKYKVPITSLEEFCGEAKANNMIVMLQYKDDISLGIAKGILGKDLIMYNAPRSSFDGVILEYLYYNTKAEILQRCETVGKPYIYSMDNPSKFDDETLIDIAKTLHEKGYYLASAYVGTGERYSKLGFDLFAIDGVARDLEDNQTILNGKVITFNSDGTVTWESI